MIVTAPPPGGDRVRPPTPARHGPTRTNARQLVGGQLAARLRVEPLELRAAVYLADVKPRVIQAVALVHATPARAPEPSGRRTAPGHRYLLSPAATHATTSLQRKRR